jgi:hypothetical protein
MLNRLLHRLRPLLAAALALGLVAAIPAMTAAMAMGQGQSMEHHSRQSAPPADDCCFGCVAPCTTALPPLAEAPAPIVPIAGAGPAYTQAPSERVAIAPLPHRLPFAHGPPSLHA